MLLPTPEGGENPPMITGEHITTYQLLLANQLERKGREGAAVRSPTVSEVEQNVEKMFNTRLQNLENLIPSRAMNRIT